MDSGKTLVAKLLRHTDASPFVGSGTIRDGKAILRPRGISLHFVRRESNSPADFLVAGVPRMLGANIQDRNRLARAHARFDGVRVRSNGLLTHRHGTPPFCKFPDCFSMQKGCQFRLAFESVRLSSSLKT